MIRIEYCNSDKVTKRREVLNSIGLAILLCANPLSWLYPVDNIILVYAFISLLIAVLNNPITTFINYKLWFIIGVFIIFISSYLFANIDSETFFLYFFSFLAFGVTGLFYSSTLLSYSVLFKSIFLIAFISMPGVYRVAITDYSLMGDVSGYWMGISQGIVRLIMGCILVYSVFSSKISKLLTIPAFIVYIYFMILYGTRGATLALIVFLLLLYLQYKNWLKLSRVIILIIIGIVLKTFYFDIARHIVSLLSSFDIEFKALDKMVRLHDSGLDMSNGRNEIWNWAFSGFLENPLFGNGISTFTKKYNIYPHNFFLEILYEGGLLYGIPIILVLLSFFRLILSDKINKEKKRKIGRAHV